MRAKIDYLNYAVHMWHYAVHIWCYAVHLLHYAVHIWCCAVHMLHYAVHIWSYVLCYVLLLFCWALWMRHAPAFYRHVGSTVFENISTMSIWQGGNIQNSYLYRKIAEIVSKSFRKTRNKFRWTKKHIDYIARKILLLCFNAIYSYLRRDMTAWTGACFVRVSSLPYIYLCRMITTQHMWPTNIAENGYKIPWKA